MPDSGGTSPASRHEIAGEVAFRARGFVHRPSGGAAAATLIGLLALWQAGAAAGLLSTQFLPPPLATLRALWELTTSGQLGPDLSASLVRLVWGWAAGTLAGVAVGLVIGLLSPLRSPVMAVVSALFPIPKIALVPLFIIWFGIGEGSKLVTIGLGVFFPTVIATVSGVDAVSRNLIRMGQSFGLPWRRIVTAIILPGALPSILAGFRVTTSIAIILLVAAEMIGAKFGIGAFVLRAGSLEDSESLLAGILVLSVLGIAISLVLGWLERLLLRWR